MKYDELTKKKNPSREQMDKSRRELELKAAEVEDRQRKFEEFEKKSAELEEQIVKFKQESEQEKLKNKQLKSDYENKIHEVVAGQEQLQKKVGESEAEKAALKEQMELQNMTLSQLRKHMADVQKQLETQGEARKKDLERIGESSWFRVERVFADECVCVCRGDEGDGSRRGNEAPRAPQSDSGDQRKHSSVCSFATQHRQGQEQDVRECIGL